MTDRWNELLQAEDAAAQEIYRRKEAGEIVDTDELREWWGLVEEILRATLKPDRTGVPVMTLARLAGIVGYLRAGRIPDIITDTPGRRRPNAGPTEERHQQAAVAYVLACRKGIIEDDNKHTRTVADCFGVRTRTVTRWVQQWEAVVDVEGASGLAIEKRMKAAAEYYRAATKARRDGSDI